MVRKNHRRKPFSRAATRRAASCGRFARSNKGADKLISHLSGQRIDLEALTRQEGSRVFVTVNSRGLDIDIVKTAAGPRS